MDFTPAITQVLDTLGFFIPLIPLIGLPKSPWAKGHIGVLLMHLLSHWRQDKRTYRHLHNVTLNKPDGTTQIGHVFLSSNGTFRLETNYISCWIFGREMQPEWTHKLYKHTFKSGIHSYRSTSTSRRWRPPLAIMRPACTRSSP
jgi:hypothetical protein